MLNKIDKLSIKFIPFEKVSILSDAPDSRFLELGIAAHADFLITGNHSYFKLTEYGTMKIVSPNDYITKYFA